MFRRGKSYSQVGLVSKQLFQQEIQPLNYNNSSNAFGPSVQFKSGEKTGETMAHVHSEIIHKKRANKLFTSSSTQLFAKARSVSKGETFLRKKEDISQSLSSTKDRMIQHAEELKRLKHKVVQKESQIQRKLLIKRVLQGKAANYNISIIKEMSDSKANLNIEKRNVLSILSKVSGLKEEQTKQIQQKLTRQHGKITEKPLQLYKESIREELNFGTISQQLKPELSYSMNNDSLKKSETLGKQQLRLCLSEMQLSLKQSIREEIQGVYKKKEKQLVKSYEENIRQYDKKLKIIQEESAKRSEVQQKAFENLIKYFQSKIEQVATKKLQQQVKINRPQPPTDKEHKKKSTKEILLNQKQQKVTKIQKEEQIVQQTHFAVRQVQTFDRKDSSNDPKKMDGGPQGLYNKGEKPKVAKNTVKGQANVDAKSKQATKTQKNKIFEQASSNFQDQIQQIKLNLDSRNPGIKNQKNAVAVNKDIDRSFQIPNRHLNQSFESQQANRKETNKPYSPPKNLKTASVNNQPQQSKFISAQAKQIKNETQKKQPELSQAETKKAQLRQKLMNLTQQDPYLTSLGQVVSYCSKFMKKSKLKWRLPSLLLYRYCYDGYRLHTPFYEEGLKVGILKQIEIEKFKGESVILWENMMKVLKATLKKNEINPQQQKLVQSENSMVEKLKDLIDKEVKNFIDTLWESQETSDVNVLQCGLRMINGVFIIRKLNGSRDTPTLQNIEDLSQKETKAKFEQWANKLDDILSIH